MLGTAAEVAAQTWRGHMNFKKLFQLLVVGGAALGALSGCATAGTAGTAGADASSPPKSNFPPPPSGSGGIRGW
jgi:hypothetical protein